MNRKMQLTVNPHIFNACLSAEALSANMIVPGYVASVEEKGYLVDFGLQDGAQGFIKHEDCEGKYEEKDWMMVGVVSANVKAKIINCVEAGRCRDKKVAYSSKISLETLKPGWLVDAVVKQVLVNGIYVHFLRNMEGTVFVDHLTKPLEKYSRNEKVALRVTMVDLASKVVNLSAKQHLVQLVPSAPPLKTGAVVPSATVSSEAYGGSYYLSLDAPEGVKVFLHKSHAKDLSVEEKVENVLIKEYNYFDGIHIGSLDSSESESITWQSIEPGDFLTGTIERAVVDPGKVPYILVKVNEFMLGTLPLEHTADRPLSRLPEKLTLAGRALRLRVFAVNRSAKILTLTRKKALLKQSAVAVLNRENVEPLSEVCGVVDKEFENGRLVKFFGDIVGFLPAEEIPQNATLKNGQTIGIFVAYNNVEQKRIGLSLILEGAKRLASKQPLQSNDIRSMFRSIKADMNIALPEEARDSIAVGDIYTFRPTSSGEGVGAENFLMLRTTDLEHNFYAYVPKFQVSDYKEHNEKLFKLIGEGSLDDKEFKGIILDILQPHNILVVSLKSSLVWAKERGKLPSQREDLAERETYYGYVGGTIEKGAFVHFLGGLKGFLANGELENSLEKAKNVWPGKALRVAVTRIEGQNVYLSTKIGKIYGKVGTGTKEKRKVQREVLEEMKMRISSFYREVSCIENSVGSGQIWKNIHYGDYVKGTITTIEVRVYCKIRIMAW